MLGRAVDQEAGECVHDVPVGVHAEPGDAVVPAGDVVNGKPDPLGPFAGARIHAVKRVYGLMA